jgi:hypothetical protein
LRRLSAYFFTSEVFCRDGDVKTVKAPALGVAQWEGTRYKCHKTMPKPTYASGRVRRGMQKKMRRRSNGSKPR